MTIDYFIGELNASEIIKLDIPDYNNFYNDEIRKLVEEVYRDDITNYGYQYPF